MRFKSREHFFAHKNFNVIIFNLHLTLKTATISGLDSMGEHVTSGDYAECVSVRLRFHIWLTQSA